ncbi:MAG: isopeptide-forming domain-containing fimbrial protein [Lachnospiraceae bacterium]|jgi:fimbrial isopeptide formation D2 family protein/uncharacterized repeat protein (TIGR02543 family)
MKKKVLSFFLICVLMLALLPGAAVQNISAAPTGSQKPADYVRPVYEEGKINLNGYYTVANDGQVTAELEWSFPYENPQRPGEGMADPARPYNYRMWQSKQLQDGSWTAWETRSPVDVDARDGSVRVLNVAPNSASMNYLKNWMNMAATDYDGSSTTVGRGIITVDSVLLDNYNANPNAYLKDSDGTYKYNVIMFGTYDANASKDLSVASRDATVAFAKAGGGLMFGHDTVVGNAANVGSRNNFYRFAESDFLNLDLTKGDYLYGSNYVKVTDTGFLTSRPWNLEGKTLNIPNTHVLGQKVNAGGSRVWMQMSDANGNVYGTKVAPGAYSWTDNYYLLTNGACAMIQTGHTSGGATLDEAKVFANTLIYIAQTTTTTTARDSSFIDEEAPDKPQGQLAGVTPSEDLTQYTATVELSGSKDYGTTYAYRIQGIKSATIDQSLGIEYPDEVWSTAATDPEDETVYKGTALSGLRGYYVSGVNTNKNPVAVSTVPVNQVLSASSAEDEVTYETGILTPGVQYYIHAYAVDYAGNVSQDLVIPVSVSANKATFYHNDGTDNNTQTLLSQEGKLAFVPKAPVREGYEFLGWYEDKDGNGDAITADQVFDLNKPEYLEGVKLYAKWVKTWKVMLGQRGEGEVTLSASENGNNPYWEGTDVTVSYVPEEGYSVKAVWLDGVMQLPDESGELVIPAIDKHHYVLVEFVDELQEPEFYSVDTQLSGGDSKSSITPSVRFSKEDPRATNYTVSWNVSDGYVVTSVMVDGMKRADLLGENKVVFSKVTGDHRVEVTLGKEDAVSDTAQITTKLIGGPGSITPSADVSVGDDHTVQVVVADPNNYEIDTVTVTDQDGNPVANAVVDKTTGQITLPEISKDYQVVVQLAPKKQAGTITVPESEQLRVDTSKTGQGTVSDSRIVQRGDNYTVEWEAAEGWSVLDVTINGNKIYYNPKTESDIAAFSLVAEGTSGEQPFEDIQENKSVHVTFVKDSVSDEGEDGQPKDHYAVKNYIRGDADVSMTASNGAVTAGDTYEVAWKAEEGSIVTHVWVNGEARDDLLEAGKFVIDNIDGDYVVEVCAERIGDPQPSVDKTVVNESRKDKNLVGDRLTYTLTAKNNYPYRDWENAVLQDCIPAGMELDPDSMTLEKNGTELKKPSASCYDVETRTLTVPIGTLSVADTYILTFQTVITQDAIRPDNANAWDLTNVALGKGDNGVTGSQEVAPNDVEDAKPLPEPESSLVKTAVNQTSKDNKAQVKDKILYSLKARNAKYGSVWTGVRILDKIPAGLNVDTDSIYLVDPNGVPTKLSAEVYDAASRTLAVFVGDIYGEEAYEVQFVAVVDQSAIGKEIGNVGEAHGGTPLENGKPGHWGSEEEYKIKSGSLALESVVKETIITQSEMIYLGSKVTVDQEKAVPTGDSGAWQMTVWMLLAILSLSGVLVCRRMRHLHQK